MGHMKVHVEGQKSSSYEIVYLNWKEKCVNYEIWLEWNEDEQCKDFIAWFYNLKEVKDLCVIIDAKFKEVWKHF